MYEDKRIRGRSLAKISRSPLLVELFSKEIIISAALRTPVYSPWMYEHKY